MSHATLRIAAAMLLAAFAAGHAHADWDAKLEAEEKAQRDRSAAIDRQRNAEAKARLEAAQARGERAELGPQAEGKTNAQVHELYLAKVKRDNAESLRQARAFNPAATIAEAQAASKRANDPKQRAAADEGARIAGGKSMNDLQNMSQADLLKLQADLERKYGKQP